MRVVTRRTGLGAEILRVWERRYGVVKPGRTQTGRRLYSDDEIERLQLLHRATRGGRSIGQIASLSTTALTELLRQDAVATEAGRATAAMAHEVAPATRFLDECLRAVEAFQPETLGSSLQRALVALPAHEFLAGVVAPFLDQVGAHGQAGSLRAVHGHLATITVRRVLENAVVPMSGRAPALLVATLPGQSDELGALAMAVAGTAAGWSVSWLGAGLSADDLGEAATQLRASAVALDLTQSPGDAGVSAELRRLRLALPRAVRIVVQGSTTSSYSTVLDEIGARRVANLAAFSATLRDLVPKTGAAAPRRGRRLP